MLSNKNILITGASRGIGSECALQLAAQGAQQILLSRSVRELELLARNIKANFDKEVILHPFNLCSATDKDYAQLANLLAEKIKDLDVIILNAAILGELASLEHYNMQTWYQVMQVNLHSKFMLLQNLLPLMRQAKSPQIIFVLDTEQLANRAYWGAYAIANSATRTLAQILAQENTHITVDNLTLAPTDTALRTKAYPAEDKSSLQNVVSSAHQICELVAIRQAVLAPV